MTLLFKKPKNIFIPQKTTNIYKNITASIFTKISQHFFLTIYKNTIEYEKLILETIKLLSKKNKVTVNEQ